MIICKVSDVTNLSVIPIDNPHKVLSLLALEQLEEHSGGIGRGETVEHVEGAEDGGDARVVARVHVQQLRLFLHAVVHHLGIHFVISISKLRIFKLVLQYVVHHFGVLLYQRGPVLCHLLDEGPSPQPKANLENKIKSNYHQARR